MYLPAMPSLPCIFSKIGNKEKFYKFPGGNLKFPGGKKCHFPPRKQPRINTDRGSSSKAGDSIDMVLVWLWSGVLWLLSWLCGYGYVVM